MTSLNGMARQVNSLRTEIASLQEVTPAEDRAQREWRETIEALVGLLREGMAPGYADTAGAEILAMLQDSEAHPEDRRPWVDRLSPLSRRCWELASHQVDHWPFKERPVLPDAHAALLVDHGAQVQFTSHVTCTAPGCGLYAPQWRWGGKGSVSEPVGWRPEGLAPCAACGSPTAFGPLSVNRWWTSRDGRAWRHQNDGTITPYEGMAPPVTPQPAAPIVAPARQSDPERAAAEAAQERARQLAWERRQAEGPRDDDWRFA
jgi:hypothetical protein